MSEGQVGGRRWQAGAEPVPGLWGFHASSVPRLTGRTREPLWRWRGFLWAGGILGKPSACSSYVYLCCTEAELGCSWLTSKGLGDPPPHSSNAQPCGEGLQEGSGLVGVQGGNRADGGLCPSLWGHEAMSDVAEEAGPAKGLQNLGWCQPGPRASGLGPQEPCYLGRAAWRCVLGALGKSACLAPPGPLPQDQAVTSSLLHVSAVLQPGPGEALRVSLGPPASWPGGFYGAH